MSRKRKAVKKTERKEDERVNDHESPIRETSEEDPIEEEEEQRTTTTKKSKTNKISATPSKPDRKVAKTGPEANQDGEYKIDRIIEMQVRRNGKREFLVKWAGYSVTESTWEPEDNLEGTSVLEKFLKKVEKVKEIAPKQLRVVRMPTDRYTLTFPQREIRHSKRNDGKQRVKYHDAE